MIKTYVTVISLQGGGNLERGVYEPVGFQLKNNRETSFPIIPVIAESMEEQDEIKIIAVRTKNNDSKDNYRAFLEELSMMGIEKTQVKEITQKEDQRATIGLTMLMELLQEIPEDSLVYADITFGTKPMSAIILYAMNFIEKLKDSEVEGIYYGELPREKGKSLWERAKIYNLTIFKYISDVIDQLDVLGISDPQAALKKLLDI